MAFQLLGKMQRTRRHRTAVTISKLNKKNNSRTFYITQNLAQGAGIGRGDRVTVEYDPDSNQFRVKKSDGNNDHSRAVTANKGDAALRVSLRLPDEINKNLRRETTAYKGEIKDGALYFQI